MYSILCLLSILLNTVPRIIDIGTGSLMDGGRYSDVGRWWYYTGQSASFLFLILAHLFPRNKITFEITLWLIISNLLDEMFFDPTRLQLNELAFAVLITICTIRRCTILKKKH